MYQTSDDAPDEGMRLIRSAAMTAFGICGPAVIGRKRVTALNLPTAMQRQTDLDPTQSFESVGQKSPKRTFNA